MIYIMNTKTFKEIFSKEDPKKIAKTQFIIVSRRIRKTMEEDSVIFFKKLFPSDMLLSDVNSFEYKVNRIGKCTEYFEENYRRELDRYKLSLAVIIKGVVEENLTEMILCTYKEWNLGFLKILAKYIEDEFHYPVIDYKKYKLKKKLPKRTSFDREEVIAICDRIIYKEMKKKRKEKMKTREGRMSLLRNMSKDEMKQTLKKLNLYSPGLDKRTMKDLLKEFFVD